jgi:hypothetical protein
METKTIVVEVESNLGSLKSQLREAQAEVSAMAEKFGATSTEAINAAKAAARLKDTIGDAKAMTDAFNPDAKFKALTASMSGALNGFQAVEGAMGLFGAEGKAVQETLLKVQSAMALAQGVDGLLEAKDAFKTFGATVVNGMKAIKVSMLTLPIFWIIGGIALLTAAFIYLESTAQTAGDRIVKGFNGVSRAVDTTVKSIERLGKTQDTATNNLLKNLDLEAKRRIAMGEDATKVQKEINALKIEGLKIAIQEDRAATKALKNIIDTLEVETKRAKGKLAQQILDAKAESESALTAFGMADALQRMNKLSAQYNALESESNKSLFESRKLLYAKTAEIVSSKDAVAELQIAQLELNKTEKEGRDAKKDKEEKVSTDFKSSSEFDMMNEGDIFAEGLRKKESDRIDASNLEKEAARTAELEGISWANQVKEEKRLEDEAADKKAQEEKLARNKQIASLSLDATKQGLQGISDLVGAFAGKSKAAQKKAFNTQKKLNIAIATIDTIKGAVSAFTGMTSTIPGPVGIALGVVAAAGVAASGVAQVKKISSTTFDGGGGGGGEGAGGVGGMNAPSVPTPANFNVVGNSGTNQLMQGLQSQPIKAYVVGGDVTTAQNLDRNKITTASI